MERIFKMIIKKNTGQALYVGNIRERKKVAVLGIKGRPRARSVTGACDEVRKFGVQNQNQRTQ